MLSSELYPLLYTGALGKQLDPNELEMIIKYGKNKNFSAGEIILQQGKESNGIYIVIEGIVTISAKILGEGKTDLETLGPGSFLGEISFFEKVPCATSITAISQVQCLYLTGIYFEMISNYFPETKYKLFLAISKQVCIRLRKMHDKITAFISNSDMLAKSLFSDIIHSLTKPAKVSFEEINVDISQLQKTQLFSFFTKDETNELLKHSCLLKASKNCTLIHKGEKDASCYIVIQGAVQSSIMYDKKVAKLSVIGPTRLFASVACIDNSLSFTITFFTCEQAILLRLSDSDLDYFKTNQPALWYKLFDLICRSLVALEKSVDKLDVRLNIETYNR